LDSTPIGITNEGYGHASAATTKAGSDDEDPTIVFVANGAQDWYKRTVPTFEVSTKREGYKWHVSTVFLMVLKASTQQEYVELMFMRCC
jgi:hypothetical protein